MVYWAVGIGGSIVPVFASDNGVPANYLWGYMVAALLQVPEMLVSRIHLHRASEEACFWLGLMSGIASYWMPTVLFMILPFWIYIISRNFFTLRCIVSTMVGVGIVALYASLAIWQGWLTNVWVDFFALDRLWGWIPVCVIGLSWGATLLTRHILYIR